MTHLATTKTRLAILAPAAILLAQIVGGGRWAFSSVRRRGAPCDPPKAWN